MKMGFRVVRAVFVWYCGKVLSGKAPQLASTPASCSKQAAQLSPGGCSARFVPACVWALVFEPWDGVGKDGMGVRSGG